MAERDIPTCQCGMFMLRSLEREHHDSIGRTHRLSECDPYPPHLEETWIDYRDLLKKYMTAVIEAESVTHVSYAFGLTPEEKAALLAIADEVEGRYEADRQARNERWEREAREREQAKMKDASSNASVPGSDA